MRTSAARAIAIGFVVTASGLLAMAGPDEPAPVLVRFRPSPRDRYAADYEEHVKVQVTFGKKAKQDVQTVDAKWRIEFAARDARKDGAVPLETRIVSLTGTYVGIEGDKVEFDSATGKCDGKLVWPELANGVLGTVGKQGVVVVSATGDVLEAAAAFDGLADTGKPGAHRAQEVVAFFERFFASLPVGPVKAGGSWSAPRWIAPHLVVATEHLCGAVEERYRLPKIGDGPLSVTISGDGTAEAATRKMAATPLPSKLKKWSSIGTIEVDRDTGLPTRRSSKVELKREEYFKDFDCTIRYAYSIESTLVVQRVPETPSGK